MIHVPIRYGMGPGNERHDQSTRTVQKHLERVFHKLGVETRTGAILKA